MTLSVTATVPCRAPVTVGVNVTLRVQVVPAASEVQGGSRIVVSTAERLTDGTFVHVMQDTTNSAATLAEAK